MNEQLALMGLGGGEIILIAALVLVLFGAKKLPEIGNGLGEGFRQFRKATCAVSKEFDQGARDAGESFGGIYGKPAVQALTPDNQTAELYDPAAFNHPDGTRRIRKRNWFGGWRRVWRLLMDFFSQRLPLRER